MYRMLSGNSPHQEADTAKLLHAVIERDAPNLNKTNERIPAAVAALLSQMLSRNPDDRPYSADLVAERIRELESDVLAPPRPLKTTTAKPVLAKPSSQRINPGVWIGAGVIALAAIIGAIALILQMARHINDGSDDEVDAAAAAKGAPIRVGVLHSQRGTYAMSEQTMIEAIDFAAKEINEAGGVLGRQIELKFADGESDEDIFARRAEKLIAEDKVSVIFGCWSSAARKRVAAVCEQHHNLLVYSCVYEGLEQSPNVVYVGGAPNQQLQPCVKFAFADRNKRRFFVVGSDAVFSRRQSNPA